MIENIFAVSLGKLLQLYFVNIGGQINNLMVDIASLNIHSFGILAVSPGVLHF
jgi:hypothetical protein